VEGGNGGGREGGRAGGREGGRSHLAEGSVTGDDPVSGHEKVRKHGVAPRGHNRVDNRVKIRVGIDVRVGEGGREGNRQKRG